MNNIFVYRMAEIYCHINQWDASVQYLTDIPRQREEYEVIYGTRRNAECLITSILRAGVEYLFYYTPNSQS